MATYNETIYVVAVERDVDFRKQPSLDETYVVHSCEECGALVRDTAVHDEWHRTREAMDRTVQNFMDTAAAGEEYV